MELGNKRGNLGEGSTTTNGNARPTTRRSPGRLANGSNQNGEANVGAGNLPVDMEMVYHFFTGLMQAGAAGNVGVANPVVPVGNIALKSGDYISLGGKPFLRIKSAIEV